MFLKKSNKRIYLDYASSTPIDRRVLSILSYLQESIFGNAGGVHKEGVQARTILDDARIKIAKSIDAHSDEIIFTSGGTESDNLALLGILGRFKKDHPTKTAHIIVSSIEHPAIFELAKYVEECGLAEVSYIPVTSEGIVDTEEFKKLLRLETIFVSVMHANNEIGTLQPIREITKIVRHHKKINKEHRDETLGVYPYVHTDACQSFVYEKIRVEELGVDLLTINSSKIYGPKGAGALFVKRGTKIDGMLIGGSQEHGLRAGTENVPLYAGFAQAVEINEGVKEKESARLSELRDYFITALKENFEVTLHGTQTERLPNNINVSFIGYQSEQIVIYLDAQGIAVSEKSACKADSGEVSHVLKALYTAPPETGGATNPILNYGPARHRKTASGVAGGSVRFSLGRGTTKKDLDTVINKMKDILKLLTKTI